MFVILTQDVPKMGQKDSLHKVKRGYYVNYLLPKSLAKIATAGMIGKLKDKILAAKEAAKMAKKQIGEKAQLLTGAKIILEAKASAKGTLFRAIAEKTVAKEIMEKYHVEIDPKNIEMEHVKQLGEHEVKVKLGQDVVTVKVEVSGKE